VAPGDYVEVWPCPWDLSPAWPGAALPIVHDGALTMIISTDAPYWLCLLCQGPHPELVRVAPEALVFISHGGPDALLAAEVT